MFQYTLLRLTIIVLKYVNLVLKATIGYSFLSGRTRERLDFDQYSSKCVHRMKVLWKCQMGEVGGDDSNSFLLAHMDYQTKDILKADHISFYFFSKKYAYFLESPTGANIYDTNIHPFLYNAQFKSAQVLLRVSVDNFVEFATEIGNPKANVVSLYNTGRCGSTLLTQMLEAVPRTVVMCEPMFQMNLILSKIDSSWPAKYQSDMTPLIRACYKVACKSIEGMEADTFVIKSASAVVSLAGMTTKACPFIKNIFMYRAPKPNIQSFRAMFSAMPRLFMILARFIFFKDFSKLYPDDYKKMHVIKELEKTVLPNLGSSQMVGAFYALHLVNYQEYRDHHGVEFFPLRYEHLLAEPKTTIRDLLTYCQMPTDTLDHCIEVMAKDSQRGSTISKDKLQAVRPKDFSPQEVQDINHIFHMFDLPDMANIDRAFDQINR